MAENSQLSDETKNNSTDTSSTDASSAVIGNHENAVVPHKISNHDKLVQTMVMVDGEWINVNDTNDQANMKEDMHKVNKKVVEAQKGIVEAKNTADSAVKYADSAVSASKVNSDALIAQSSAISEAKAAADDAASKAQFIKENASSEAAAIRNQVADVANNVSSVKADVASAASDVANLKVDVQTNSAAIIKTNEAVSVQSKSSSDAINELKIANGQVELIAKDAKNNATVAKQTADTATTLAQDAKSNAVLATQTATSATVEATNATSAATKAELSVNGLTTRVTAVEGDNKKLSNQFISTETILQQTKDQLLRKADKSVVDQANNLISQLSAEQKTMAGQISQKVSSSEYQTLRDKVNNLRIGGRNLIPNSGTDIVIESKTTDPYPAWDNKAVYWDLTPGETYTFSSSALGTNGVNKASMRIFNEAVNKEVGNANFYFPADGKRHSKTFTIPDDGTSYSVYLYAGHMGKIEGKNFATTYHHPQLELGNIESDYSPNPDDTITSIQKNTTAIDENNKEIKLKADAAEVNNLKGTVNSHSASINLFSDQLKNMVTESKVNDIINGKGFTTQNIVQSLIDQKAGTLNESITNLSTELKNNSGGGVNLLANSKNMHSGWSADGTSIYPLDDYLAVKSVDANQRIWQNPTEDTKGKILSVSFDAEVPADSKNKDVQLFVGPFQAALKVTITGNTFKRYKIENWKWNGSYNALSIQFKSAGDKINIKNIKLEYGPAATPYSPAPSDNATVTQLQSVTASIDGLQSAVTNYQKDASSKYTQLSDLMQSKVNKGELESVRTQLASSINERVKSGDLLSQINIAAGHTLIQSNKIYFDADSFVMSPNSKAFIPSAYITNINADKITTGTLDAAKFNVKNFSADNIVGGTLSGVVVKTGANDRYFQTSKDNIYWVRNGSMSLIGNDTYLNSANGLNIADENNIQLTTWGGATVNKDGSITNLSGSYGHPRIVIDREGKYNPDAPGGETFGGGPGDSEIVQWVGEKEYTALTRGKGLTVHLNDSDNESIFAIQKDNKLGFYVGQGDNGNQLNVQFAGDGSGFNVHGNFNVYGAKNSAVNTSQGDVAVSAYETAEYYFGDIGEGQTDFNGIAYVGIEKLFNETVNTNIPYQVFLTAYGSGNLWVAQREHDRFVVKSDRPNVKFGWEIKAKRRGYENTRLQKVN